MKARRAPKGAALQPAVPKALLTTALAVLAIVAIAVPGRAGEPSCRATFVGSVRRPIRPCRVPGCSAPRTSPAPTFSGPEILRYLNHVADRFDLRRDITLRTRVASAVFDETDDRWRVRTDDGTGRRWDEMRAAMAPDFVFVDHRTLGLGTLDADRWVASMQALAGLAPDVAVETTHVLAWNHHGIASAQRNFGTVPSGGPFENLYVNVALIAGGRLQRFEAFDPTDADRAVARFAELCVGQTA